jgi:hypothetical protein
MEMKKIHWLDYFKNHTRPFSVRLHPSMLTPSGYLVVKNAMLVHFDQEYVKGYLNYHLGTLIEYEELKLIGILQQVIFEIKYPTKP